MEGASPLWQQLLFFVLAPPIAAMAFSIMARGWANVVQSGDVSETTRKRQKLEFWVMLCFMYVMLFCIFLYAHFRHH